MEGIAPNHLSAAGYGEFHPIGPNVSDESRKLNRRVDLVIAIAAPSEVER
jgi:chemotaxis protein MotB